MLAAFITYMPGFSMPGAVAKKLYGPFNIDWAVFF